jgi:hypothetical protein
VGGQPYGFPVRADRRRWGLTVAVLLVLVLAGCSSVDDRPMPVVHKPAVEPVREALWIVDDEGIVRAYDGRSKDPMAMVGLGVAASSWGLLSDGRSIWAFGDGGRIVRLDPVAARVTGRGQLPAVPRARLPIAPVVAHGAVWTSWGDQLWRVGADAVATRVALPAGLELGHLAAGERWLWLATVDGWLFRLDPTSGVVTPVGGAPVPQIAAAFQVPGAYGRAGQFGETAEGLVVVGPPATVTVLDPTTAAVRWTMPLPCESTIDGALHAASPHSWVICDTYAIPVAETGSVPVPLGDTWAFSSATGFGSLWIPDDMTGQLVRVEATGSLRRFDLPLTGENADLVLTVLPGRQGVWIIDSDEGVGVMHLSPQSNRVSRIVRPNSDLTGSAVIADPPSNVGAGV